MTYSVENESLIGQIVDIELEMFSNVNSFVRSSCQDNLSTFKVMRWMHHSVLPTNVLKSCLVDLNKAREDGRNLMVEKYARMENRLPCHNDSCAIDAIVETELQWMLELAEVHPEIFPGSGESFKDYMACELETLTGSTLELLWQTVKQAKEARRNLVEERYQNLFRRLGYGSLEEWEQKPRPN